MRQARRLRHGAVLLATLGVTLGSSRLRAQQADTLAVRQATAATTSWLALVDAGKYDSSWTTAASAFRQAVSQADWAQALTRARGPLEPFGARTLLGARYLESIPNAPPGPYVIIQYQTKAGGGREVVETVSLVREGLGHWLVGGYYVKPAP